MWAEYLITFFFFIFRVSVSSLHNLMQFFLLFSTSMFVSFAFPSESIFSNKTWKLNNKQNSLNNFSDWNNCCHKMYVYLLLLAILIFNTRKYPAAAMGVLLIKIYLNLMKLWLQDNYRRKCSAQRNNATQFIYVSWFPIVQLVNYFIHDWKTNSKSDRNP